MVVHDKKTGEVCICVDLRKLNDAFLHDPFPTPFTDEVLEGVGGQGMYSFTNGFSGYHQIRITKEDRHKTTFVTEWGCFQYTVMTFGLKNVPAIFLGWLSLRSNISFKNSCRYTWMTRQSMVWLEII